MREYRTVKLWKSTWKLINVARAETEETLVEFVHRLVEEEMTRIGFRRARRGEIAHTHRISAERNG